MTIQVEAKNSEDAYDKAFIYSDKVWNIESNNWAREHTELYVNKS
jgi:hypothetical protein